uniref:Uncharacterized protein n=1 Tax=Ciona savignyi TaxID=51511 RepID=H2YN04_CIOSA
METKNKERKIPYKQNLPEVESLKRKLETADREISFTKKLNSELKEENYKLKVEFDNERVKLLKKHDEEERNWENLKHQLLGKIEYLEEINVTSFPLHGSQVTSSSAEDQRHQRSLGELKLGEIAEPTRYNANLQSPNVSMNLSAIPSNYEQFHTTVDAALKQIEKISEDLENINTESPSQSFDLAPPVTTDTAVICSDQNLISHPTMPRLENTTSDESSETTIPRDKPGEVFSMMKEDKRKRSKSFCTRSYDDMQPVESLQ